MSPAIILHKKRRSHFLTVESYVHQKGELFYGEVFFLLTHTLMGDPFSPIL
jgi:hypothetical protein